MKYLIFLTFWGWMGAARTSSGLKQLVLPCPSDKEVEERLFKSRQNTEDRMQETEDRIQNDDASGLKDLAHRIRRYLEGYDVSFPDKVDHEGSTVFQKEVWLSLRDIPYGKTISYSELANRLGKPGAARAIGQALSRNPLPIILPCHRVIGRKGELTGYSGGAGLKRRLLDLETRNCK